MKNIKIEIPDNLNEIQEGYEIQRQLGKRLLKLGAQNTRKQIGNGIEIKDLETTITIIRKSFEKVDALIGCPFCETQFLKSLGRTAWTNYGGVFKRHFYCSDDCRDTLINIAGEGRAAISKRNLKPLRTF